MESKESFHEIKCLEDKITGFCLFVLVCFWLCWVFIAVQAFVAGALPRRGARALGVWVSGVVTRGLSSSGSVARAQGLAARGRVDFPRAGIEPLSPCTGRRTLHSFREAPR